MNFAKAHACGNDFLIVEAPVNPDLAKQLCDRHTLSLIHISEPTRP